MISSQAEVASSEGAEDVTLAASDKNLKKLKSFRNK